MSEVKARLKGVTISDREQEALHRKREAERRNSPEEWEDENPETYTYRIICGRKIRDCPALLGYAMQRAGTEPSQAWPGRPSIGPGQWWVAHENGFRQCEDGSYEVVRSKRRGSSPIEYPFPGIEDFEGRRAAWDRRIGRRPLPRALLAEGVLPMRGIFGQMPILPAIIVCPVCRSRNRVEPPPQG
jgi:hypothetical protein